MSDNGQYSRERPIDKPLGQTGAPSSPQKSVKRHSLPYMLLAGLAIAVPAAWIALSQDPFRQISNTEDEAPLQQKPREGSDVVDTGKTPVGKTRDGPTIIKVDPGNSGTPASQAPGSSSQSVIVIRDPSELKQTNQNAHLPDRALIEQSSSGPLPVTGADGRRPFDVYAGNWSGSRGAKIAVIIGGLGLSQTGTQNAIQKLPSNITLAFSPEGNSLKRWMEDSRRRGHEVMLQLPLEPFDFPRVNPGRNTLTVENTIDQNLRNLHWAMGRMTNYVGVMNYMGARFLTDEASLQPVMADLSARGLMFLDDGSAPRSLVADLAATNRMPYAGGDTIIDESQSKTDILSKLEGLEATARARGFAIGSGSAFDLTVETVAAWAREATRRGIEIVPVSALAADPKG